MKLFTKICLILAAVAGGLGILGIIIGLILGADINELNNMGIYVSPHQQVAVSGVITEVVEEEIVTEMEEVVENIVEESVHIYNDVTSKYQENAVEHNYLPTEEIIVRHPNETEHHYIPNEKNTAHHNEKLYNHACSFRGVKRLEIEVQNAEIVIFATESTDDFIYYSNKEKAIAKVDGSTLKLEDHSSLQDKIELEIYIPLGELKEIEIEAINGTVSADKMAADNVTIEIDNAAVEIEELIVENKAELKINAGQMVIGYYSGTELETECAMGSIMVVCEGNQNDYNYDLECGMGQIQIQENKYSGIGKDLQIHNESDKFIKAECALGEIILEFPNSL